MRTFVALTVSLVWSWSALAQEPPVRAGEKVHVHTISTGEVLRGVVLEAAQGVLRVRIDDRGVDVPMDDVRRLDVEVRDSLTNGTLIGAAAFGLWCALICGQGLDSGDDLPRALLANTALGAALGAFVDSKMSSRRVVYERPRQARRSRLPIAVPMVTLRF